MPLLRLSIVYWAGWYSLIGPISRTTIYRSQSHERVKKIRDLFLNSGLAWELLDPPNANRVEILGDDFEWDTPVTGLDALVA